VDTELVILVDEDNRVVGTMPKSEVHGATTPLHRAFSAFVFRARDRQLLLQQRSARKKTWPLVWSNTCCGHPTPGETNEAAAMRRLKFELGLKPVQLEEVAPYRYCHTRDGTMENEVCPILVGVVDHEPAINPDEVESVRWVAWRDFLESTEADPSRFSEWCIEEAQILDRTPMLRKLLGSRV
jgi:isopentenyl-diphosphate Delta-isomerase